MLLNFAIYLQMVQSLSGFTTANPPKSSCWEEITLPNFPLLLHSVLSK